MNLESSAASFRAGDRFDKSIATGMLSVGDETVVFDQLSAKTFRLNATARTIWEFLEARPTLSDIVAHVAAKYDIPAEQSEAASRSLLAKLLDAGLVAVPNHEVIIRSENMEDK